MTAALFDGLWQVVPIALAVGIMMGTTSIGGVLMIPALVLLLGVEVKVAMASMLATFLLTAIVGTALFQRRGTMPWKCVLPLCIPAAGLGFAGAWTNSVADATWLIGLLGALMIGAGLHALWGRRGPGNDRICERSGILVGIGSATGFVSGLTGVGGPVLSVPLMLMAGSAPLAAIATGQALQVVAALSGTVGNILYGEIDLRILAVMSIVQIIGVVIGVRIAHVASTAWLYRLVAAMCVLVGAVTAAQVFIPSSSIHG